MNNVAPEAQAGQANRVLQATVGPNGTWQDWYAITTTALARQAERLAEAKPERWRIFERDEAGPIAFPPISGGSPEARKPFDTQAARAEYETFAAHRAVIVAEIRSADGPGEPNQAEVELWERWPKRSIQEAVDAEARRRAYGPARPRNLKEAGRADGRSRLQIKMFGTPEEYAQVLDQEIGEAEAKEAMPPISGGSPEGDDVEEGSSAWMNRFARKGWAGRRSASDGPVRDEDIYAPGCPS